MNHHRISCIVVCCMFVLGASPVLAQYRDNGVFVEAGPSVQEALPVTGAMVVATAAGARAWDEAHREWNLRARPSSAAPCNERVVQGQGWPCRNVWFGTTDGLYAGLGYQRVLGDLLLDLSETPLLRNLVVSAHTGLHAALTLPWRGRVLPVVLLEQDVGLRWNILDETIRPFVAMNLTGRVLFNPVGTLQSMIGMNETCRRDRNGEALDRGEVCVEDQRDLPGQPPYFNPSTALFMVENLPLMVGIRPQAGVEYFFAEDLAVQVSGGVSVLASPAPALFHEAPHLGLAPHAAVGAVVYF